MFHFPWFRSVALFIQTTVIQYYLHWVAPFGNLRIKVCLPLLGAYRSLPRPSSPADAKAFIVRPYTLDQIKLVFSAKVAYPKSLYAIVKEQKSVCIRRLPTASFIGQTSSHTNIRLSNPAPLIQPGGRDWSRTSDLVLIRDAL